MFEVGNFCTNFLIVVGVYATLQYVYDNLRSPLGVVWCLLSRKSEPFTERYGQWAVITGSSDGIGKEYAKNLARRGMNLLLISRTESKLIKLAKYIREQYMVEVKWLVVDFSEGPQIYDRIRQELEGLDIGVLVNNVGILHTHPSLFEAVPQQEIEQSITVNVWSTVMLTYMVLPEMKRRRRGMIVNMSSSSGFLPVPYMSMYSASKALVHSLTLSLQQELRNTGVECQLITPLIVDTDIGIQWRAMKGWNLISTEVKRYTKMAAWMIGKSDFTTGYWYHAVLIALMKLPPRWLLTKMVGILFRYILILKSRKSRGR
ncbi:very-long-chain 3-oxoacyl-CoA reductase-like [Topomyia yanbarensis]|uniref:very-long-chain 3-oxoacyl-CoA reductase-like n=1 Tax=Topomyia yanbarensis TaxID=2498891 RepID=UPI00273C1CF9|nr:very-long-chain 3-oxoacyl-CoA reductase-like [Topomyia yanbarensis]